MTFRFIHASDLHLGRRFANIPQPPDGNIRGRLMEARHASIHRLASIAQESVAKHILLAGDTFDTATPSDTVVQQTLASMGEISDIHWWLLPGNHDNLNDAEPLWDKIAREAPPNVHPLNNSAPVELSPEAQLLPCPVAYRSSERDPTADLASISTPDDALRIGLAHAGVVDFTDSGSNIPPDRDRSANLDYLALGDWHGRLQVSDRIHFSGSPEQDRFKHGRRGVCLSVTAEGHGAPPLVEEVEIGEFLWTEAELPVVPDMDAVAALEGLMPDAGRRDVLMRINATGWASLPVQSELRRAAARLGPDFAYFVVDPSQLGATYDNADLDEIDQAGALRSAANRLKDDAESEALSAEERAVSAGALARLYAYMKEAVE